MLIWEGRAPAMNGSFTSMRKCQLTERDCRELLSAISNWVGKLALYGAIAMRIDRGAKNYFYRCRQQCALLVSIPSKSSAMSSAYIFISSKNWGGVLALTNCSNP
jgi:hypothetical protein